MYKNTLEVWFNNLLETHRVRPKYKENPEKEKLQEKNLRSETWINKPL